MSLPCWEGPESEFKSDNAVKLVKSCKDSVYNLFYNSLRQCEDSFIADSLLTDV